MTNGYIQTILLLLYTFVRILSTIYSYLSSTCHFRLTGRNFTITMRENVPQFYACSDLTRIPKKSFITFLLTSEQYSSYSIVVRGRGGAIKYAISHQDRDAPIFTTRMFFICYESSIFFAKAYTTTIQYHRKWDTPFVELYRIFSL